VIGWGRLLQVALESLAGQIAVVVAGVLFAQLIRRWYDKWRYGGWRVMIIQNGQKVLDRRISEGKAKVIVEIPEDRGVFLKGLASPFGWINCDLIEDGPKLGMLAEDRAKRTYTIDFDKNPSPSATPVRRS
jgi:hypothetical protein